MQLTASGEIKNSPESVIRGIRDGFAAQAAVRSAQLAERGVRGFDRPLEGEAGFLAAFAGVRDAARAVVADLGSTWAGVDTSYKPWPSCRGTHAFVQAALEARRAIPVGEIREVTLIGAPVNEMLARPLAAKRQPTTAIDAKFSLPFTVASALVHGEITLASFSSQALTSPAVLDLARRVSFASDESGRLGMTSGIMRIGSASGWTEFTVDHPRGNPDDPLPIGDLRAKFVSCAGQAIRPYAADAAETVADEILAAAASPGLRAPLGRWLAA
jgi:2-methylcitrate dehydratase PrpD